MGKKKIKRKVNLAFPEGAISGNIFNKINEIYLSRALDDDGIHDLMPVIVPFSEGKILEHVGQMKKARETFKNILKKNPRNRWAKAALLHVEKTLN